MRVLSQLYRGKADWQNMLDHEVYENQGWLKGMVWIGGGVSALVVLLRVWLLPAAADWQTGMFTSNYWVIGLMVAALVALIVCNRLSGPIRREIVGSAAVAVSLASLICGVVMATFGVLDLLNLYGITAGFAVVPDRALLPTLEYVFCVLGGVALIRLGLALMSEGATRRGIAQWSILAPVLWAWFRLVSYEMSYASMVRIEDNFFGFVMLIVEILFLFRLARYASGIGRVSAGSLMFHAMATAIFALSGPLTRVGMYLLQDNLAYAAYNLAGPVDMAVGVLALVVGIALLSGKETAHPLETLSAVLDKEAEDVSASASSELLVDVAEEDGE